MSGTYIAAYVGKLPSEYANKLKQLLNGLELVPDDERHATVVYSRVEVPMSVIDGVLAMITTPLQIQIAGFDVFDTWTNGEVDPNYGSLVMLLDNIVLGAMHDAYATFGATWDYPEYNPHVTVAYKVPVELAKQVAQQMNDLLQQQADRFKNLPTINVTSFYHEPLNPSWKE